MNESDKFWTWFRSGLRKLSQRYPPLYATLAKAKHPYVGPNKRQKFCYKCAECGGLFKAEDVAVDHIIPAGKLLGKQDVAEFVDKLFCGEDGLQVLCSTCHNLKTYMEKTGLPREEAFIRKQVIAFSKLPVAEMLNVLQVSDKYETIRSEIKIKNTKKHLVSLYEKLLTEK